MAFKGNADSLLAVSVVAVEANTGKALGFLYLGGGHPAVASFGSQGSDLYIAIESSERGINMRRSFQKGSRGQETPVPSALWPSVKPAMSSSPK